MSDPQLLPDQLNESLAAIWTAYSGEAPDEVRTVIEGNVVTCVLVGAVADFERNLAAAEPVRSSKDVGRPTVKGYKLEAVATVVRLTGKGVASFCSSYDAETDVATETFLLKPAATKKSPAGERQFAHAFWLSSLPPCLADGEEV